MGNPVVHFEVSGADGPALQKFYGDLFGWHVQPMPEMNYGFVDTHAGAGVNGGIATSPEGAPGVTFYVEVPDPQASLDKASSIGGSTVMPVTEIPDIVTFAQFADPEGNVIGLVKSGEGPGVSGGDGIPVSWFEVLGNDPDALLAFYTDLFSWQAEPGDIPGAPKYFEMDTQAGKGIPGGIGSTMDGQPHVTVYAESERVQALIDRAESLGGKALMPASDIGGGQTVGLFADPQGNRFGIFSRKA